MLSRVVIKNFKSIGEAGVDLELKPLTILVGPSGGGKSSILQAIALIAQSVGSELKPHGEMISYPSLAEIAHRGETGRWVAIEFYSTAHPLGVRIQTKPETGEVTEGFWSPDGSHLLDLQWVGDHRKGYRLHLVTPDKPGLSEPTGVFGQFNIIESGMVDNHFWPGRREARQDLDTAADVLNVLVQDLRGKAFLLSALRGDVPFGSATGTHAPWVGTKGENLINLLAIIEGRAYRSVKEKIVYWSEHFGLIGLGAGLRGPSVIAADYEDPTLHTPLNLALASSGSRQVLSVIAQLFWSQPGSLLMVEEPELSLHPEAQVRLVEMFAEGIKEDKQILITTHSHYLLLSLAAAFQKGLLGTEDVAVFEITKGKESGTAARQLPVTKEGVIKGWIRSFAKVDSQLLKTHISPASRAYK